MGRLTPQEIREHEFKQAALGYGKELVHQFLDEVADELEILIRESNKIHAENKEARLTLKTYMNVEDSLKETLLLAQKTGQETIRSAQGEADTIIRKANMEKDALLFSAKESLAHVQDDISRLQAKRNTILIKLKNVLTSNLELLEEAFPDSQGGNSLQKSTELENERIIDFSKSDLIVDDLADNRETLDVTAEEAEDFSQG